MYITAKNTLSRLPLSLCALLASAALFHGAHAQSIESVSVEGTPVKLVIPAGYCKLTREVQPGSNFYLMQERLQAGKNKVLLIYADCADLKRLNSGATTLPHYGIYLVFTPNGHVERIPSSTTRAQAIDEITRAIPTLNVSDLQKDINPRLRKEDMSIEKMTTGLLGKDANAAYMGIAANATVGSNGGRFRCVSLMTFLSGMMISDSRYSPVEPGAPFDKLWAAQKLQAAALVKAN